MRDHESSLPLGPLIRWLLLVAFVGVLGLCYVQMKHRLKVDGDRRRELENTVADLGEKLKVSENEFMKMTSRPVLERRCLESSARMIQVQDTRLVRLREQSSTSAALGDAPSRGAQP